MPIEAALAASRIHPADTKRLSFLGLQFDRHGLDELVAELASEPLASFRYVVTPNVDHVVRLWNDEDRDGDVWNAYREASICVCDSRILAVIARSMGISLPVVPGSDLTAGLFESVIEAGDRIAIVGSGVETVAALQARYPGVEFVQHMPPMGMRRRPEAMEAAARWIEEADARFIFLAVGSPQQELLATLVARRGRARGAALCIGAAINFLTGESRRAPALFQRLGLEWAHRLLSEPRRLWRRYLVEGPKIFLIARRWRREEARLG
jgi:N-acetylglucosaminyldiphosphoundecaprenol N-acetyl-beta-D-mannosaminyltransferase